MGLRVFCELHQFSGPMGPRGVLSPEPLSGLLPTLVRLVVPLNLGARGLSYEVSGVWQGPSPTLYPTPFLYPLVVEICVCVHVFVGRGAH